MILAHYHPGKHYCVFLTITSTILAIKCLLSVEVLHEYINFSGRTTFSVRSVFMLHTFQSP